MKTIFVLGALALSMFGCGGAAREESATAAGTLASGGSDVVPPEEAAGFCVRLHEQMAGCSEEFTDMTIELRAKYFPPFAEQLANPEARAEIRKEGIAETVADGTGPLGPRQERCKQYVEHGPKVPRADVVEAEVCFAKATCSEKIACMRPSQEARFGARAKEPGDSTPEGAPKMK